VPADRATRTERRRREQHLRRRRRDLLEDVAIAILLTIVALIWTAGLGVIALIAVPIAGALIGSFLVERALRKRRRQGESR
jgi:Na+-translocating ferredoxin:NAD+ oxidoreductase RnfD subunit